MTGGFGIVGGSGIEAGGSGIEAGGTGIEAGGSGIAGRSDIRRFVLWKALIAP